jgi:hypothetical protein
MTWPVRVRMAMATMVRPRCSFRSAHATPQQLDSARSPYLSARRPFNNTAIDRPGRRRLNPVMRN